MGLSGCLDFPLPRNNPLFFGRPVGDRPYRDLGKANQVRWILAGGARRVGKEGPEKADTLSIARKRAVGQSTALQGVVNRSDHAGFDPVTIDKEALLGQGSRERSSMDGARIPFPHAKSDGWSSATQCLAVFGFCEPRRRDLPP